MNNQQKIVTLWTLFLLGILFHTQLGLMPLFHGQSVATASGTENLTRILWAMLGFFTVPMIAIASTLLNDSRRYRKLHFGITIFYSVMNLLHLIADLLIQPIAWYQISLMVILFIIGLLLNLISLRWIQERTSSKL